MFEESDLISSYFRARPGPCEASELPLPGCADRRAVCAAITADVKDEAERAARVDILLITLRGSIAGASGAGDRLAFVLKAPSPCPR